MESEPGSRFYLTRLLKREPVFTSLENALTRRSERFLHRLARLDGVVVFVDLDIAPAHHRTMGDVVLQLDAMGKPDRQRAGRETFRAGINLPHTV